MSDRAVGRVSDGGREEGERGGLRREAAAGCHNQVCFVTFAANVVVVRGYERRAEQGSRERGDDLGHGGGSGKVI